MNIPIDTQGLQSAGMAAQNFFMPPPSNTMIETAEVTSTLAVPIPSKPEILVPKTENIPVLVESKDITDLKISGVLVIALIGVTLFYLMREKK